MSLVMLESRSRVKHSTSGLRLIFINNDMCTVCIMVHLSDHVRLIKLHKQNRYYLCVSHLQVKVRSKRQDTYLPKTMKYSRPDFMLMQYFSFKFYAANIIFQCI